MKPLTHISIRTALQAFLLLAACGTRKTNDAGVGEGPRCSPLAYAEGDTFDTVATPALDAWIDHCRALDTAIRRGSFLASGITLRIDSLDACTPPDTATLRLLHPILAHAPDGSRSIDIWSYDHLLRQAPDGRTRLEGGGPDQMVKLLDSRNGTARQVLFHGPGQIALTADWISPDAFVLGLLNIDPATGEATADIVLIHLADSAFTNFRYPRRLPMADDDFTRHWLRTRNIIAE